MKRQRMTNWLLPRPWSLVAALVVSLVNARAGFASDAHGHAPAPSHGGHAEAHEEPETASDDATKSGSDGLDLGEFSIRAYYPVQSQKSSASFALFATVEKDKLTESRHLLEHRMHKLRDQVIVVTRMLPLEDFNDPELKNFRRRIWLQLRRTMPELSIERIYISDFALKVERI